MLVWSAMFDCIPDVGSKRFGYIVKKKKNLDHYLRQSPTTTSTSATQHQQSVVRIVCTELFFLSDESSHPCTSIVPRET